MIFNFFNRIVVYTKHYTSLLLLSIGITLVLFIAALAVDYIFQLGNAGWPKNND